MSEDLPLILGQAFAIVYGLVIGSFLAVCILRLPEDRSLLVPSACPQCGGRVRWYDNVPVVSWVVLRGRCRYCGTPISPFYPLVELLGGLLGWLVFRKVFHDPGDLDGIHAAVWVVQFGFLCLLVVSAYVDVRHRIIPDQTSIYAVPFGLAAAAALDALGWDGAGAGFRQAVAGAVIWGGLLALFSWVAWFVTRMEVLGWGDVKLIAMLGAFLGFLPTWMVLIVGSLIGSVVGVTVMLVRRRRVWLPFGPPLTIAAAAYVLWGDVLTAALWPGVEW